MHSITRLHMFRSVREFLTVDCDSRKCLKLHFLTPVLQKIQLFWDVALCRLVNSYSRFEGSYCFHLQGQKVQKSGRHESAGRNVCCTHLLLIEYLFDWTQSFHQKEVFSEICNLLVFSRDAPNYRVVGAAEGAAVSLSSFVGRKSTYSPNLLYFSTLTHKEYDFKKNTLLRMK
jgi:hypothetical protein